MSEESGAPGGGEEPPAGAGWDVPLPWPLSAARRSVVGSLGLARAAAEAVVTLPGTVRSLQRTVLALEDSVAGTLAETRESMAAVRRVAARLDALADDLEEPLRALGPGLARLARALDDPVVDDLPDTVRAIRQDVLPLARSLRGTSTAVAGLPMAALLRGLSRPATPQQTDATGRRPSSHPPATDTTPGGTTEANDDGADGPGRTAR